MYADPQPGERAARVRASEKITSIRRSVAVRPSENRCAGDARGLVEMLIAAFAYMPLATIAPKMQPVTWAGRQASPWRQRMPPKVASTNETTGLKCPQRRART